MNSAAGTHTKSECLQIFVLSMEGFPNGTAQTNKLTLFARAIATQGVPVRVLLLDAWEDPSTALNHAAKGEAHGIPFEYTAGRTTRATGALQRNTLKLWAMLRAAWLLVKPCGERRVAVFYMHDAARLLPLLLLCRMMRIATLVDVCEWMPAMPNASRANRWAYTSGAVFRVADAVIPISTALTARIQEAIGAASLRSLPLTNLVDPEEPEATTEPRSAEPPYILWAGLFDAYQHTVRFLLQALALVQRTHPELQLLLCGAASPEAHQQVIKAAAAEGVVPGSVRLMGFLPRHELLHLYRNARALLVPLEGDERSRSRFPFKLGEYLLTGQPVVSSRVGDVPMHLREGVDALLAEPDDAASFAAEVQRLLDDPQLAAQIGSAGRNTALRSFDYRSAGPRVVSFLRNLAEDRSL